ncbi:MAG: hypothetical protein BXU00_01195, partial [Candidatus Nanoclepta minutus]
MNEKSLKKLYILLLFILTLITAFSISQNPHKSVICKQDKGIIICENLDLKYIIEIEANELY